MLTLPYGNLDLGAALRLDPTLLTAALTQRSTTLDDLDLGTRPLITGAGGYLSAGMITAAPADAVLAATEDMVRTGADGEVPPLADIDGRSVVLTSGALARAAPVRAPRSRRSRCGSGCSPRSPCARSAPTRSRS